MIHTDRKRSTTDRLLNTEGAAPPAEERLAEVSSGDVERSASTSTSAGGRWYAGRCLSPSCSCRRPCGASRWSRDDADELCSAPRLRTAVEVAAAEGPAGSLGLCAAQSPAQTRCWKWWQQATHPGQHSIRPSRRSVASRRCPSSGAPPRPSVAPTGCSSSCGQCGPGCRRSAVPCSRCTSNWMVLRRRAHWPHRSRGPVRARPC